MYTTEQQTKDTCDLWKYKKLSCHRCFDA